MTSNQMCSFFSFGVFGLPKTVSSRPSAGATRSARLGKVSTAGLLMSSVLLSGLVSGFLPVLFTSVITGVLTETAAAQSPVPTPTPPPLTLAQPDLSHLLGTAAESNFPSYLKAALRQIAEEQWEEALRELDSAEKSSRHLAYPERLEFLRSYIFLRMHKPAEALLSAERAGRLRASDSDSVYLKGVALLALSKPLEAKEAFLEALWFNRAKVVTPSDINYGLGAAYAGLSNLSKASDALNAAASASPRQARIEQSRIELARGNRAAAIKAARDALAQPAPTEAAQANSSTTSATLALVRALLSSPDRVMDKEPLSEAEGLMATLFKSTAADSASYHEVFSLYVQTLLTLGKVDQAESLVLSALKKSPADQELGRLAQQVALEKAGLENQSGTQASSAARISQSALQAS